MEVSKNSGSTPSESHSLLAHLPVELLQAIFKTVQAEGSVEHKLSTAVALSSVCRLWRSIAIETATLWNDLHFPSGELDDVEDFWDLLVSRIQTAPTKLRLSLKSISVFERLTSFRISRLPALVDLQIEVNYAIDAIDVIKHHFEEEYSPLRELMITTEGGAVEPDDGRFLGELLRPFTSLSRLHLSDVTLLFLPSPILFPQITHVTLEYHEIRLPSLFLLFPSLNDLVLRYISFEPLDQTDVVTAPNLKRLKLVETDFFDQPALYRAVRLPKLVHFHTNDGNIATVCKSFLESHPTITELDCIVRDEHAISIATLLPNLTFLCVEPPCKILGDWRRAGLSSPPFPKLQVLLLDLSRGTLEVNNFEDLVRSRCLSSATIGSQAQVPPVVQELRLVFNTRSQPSVEMEQSLLYRQATKRREPYEGLSFMYCLILTWPDITM